jgi:NAD(P)H-flavin reductase
MPALPEALSAPAQADPMRPAPYRVRQLSRETGDVFTLTLDAAASPIRFEPGQFNMLYVFGVGEAPISISGDPARPELLVHTIRSVGAVTRAMQKLAPGDVVGVRGPFGSAWPVEQAQGHDLVILAGGIGLAPLRPAVYHALAHRGQYGRVVVLYGTRTPRDILFSRELKEWRGRFDLVVEVTVDRASPDWQGAVGVVTRLVDRVPFDPGSAIAFLCGPEVMMRFGAQALRQRGIQDASLFVSMERNMKCAVGLCGHCQLGPVFVCRDGPVFAYDQLAGLLGVREV